MSKLKVSPEILLHLLFPDRNNLEIHGVAFDPERYILEIDIHGPDVPNALEMRAEISVERRKTIFKPI